MTLPTPRLVKPTPIIRALVALTLLALAAYALASPPTARGNDSGFTSLEVTAVEFFEPLEHNIVDIAGTFADGTTFRANFLTNFNQTGGIERWGYPTSAVVEESPGTLSQYYQRGVVDWQPPPGGGPPTFQRRLAWDYLGGGLGGSTDQGVELHLTNPNPGDLLGPWGHKVSNTSVEGDAIGFADFFHRLGGVASFGFPKTDARQDDHPLANLHTPGRPVDSRIRQYFQAAVLEHHPESPESPVKLSLLGDTLRDARYPDNFWQQYLAFGPETPLAVSDQLDPGLENRRGPIGTSPNDVARFLELSALRIATDKACGSGFFVTESGYAVMPWHLAIDAAHISVSSPRGYSAPADLVAGDVARDLALIKVRGDGHVPIVWGDTESLAHGTELVAVSYDSTNPQKGRGIDCRPSATAKSLSAWSVQPDRRTTFVPAMNPGNLGGPVATTSGRVVGIAASSSPDLPNSDSLLPAAEARLLVDTWLDAIARGVAPPRPIRPLYNRNSLIERKSVACPRDAANPGRSGDAMAFWVRGRNIDLSATIWLNPQSLSLGLLEFGNTSARPYEAHDIITIGRIFDWRENAYANLSWTRLGFGYEGTRERIKFENHSAISDSGLVDIRFVYNSGSIAFYINGNLSHQESGLPYDEDIAVSLGCTGLSKDNNTVFYDVRVTGQIIPST